MALAIILGFILVVGFISGLKIFWKMRHNFEILEANLCLISNLLIFSPFGHNLPVEIYEEIGAHQNTFGGNLFKGFCELFRSYHLRENSSRFFKS